MTEVAKQNGSTAVANTGLNFFTTYGEATRQTAIVGKLLKFSKGDWTAGEDDTPINEGVQFVANMDELLVGWVRWSNNKPTDHVMGKVALGYQAPRRNELGDNDQDQWEVNEDGESRDPWQFTNYLLLMGEDTGEDEPNPLFTFTTSSKGGLNAIGDLCIKYGKAMRQHPNEYPIIQIGTGSYMHTNKAYGRIKYPMLNVVGWHPKADFEEIASTNDRVTEVEETAPAEPARVVKPAKASAATVAAAAKNKAQPAPVKSKSKARF